MVVISTIATIIAIIGALNWMMLGLFNFNLITMIFGAGVAANIIYIIVGIAGLWLIYYLIHKAIASSQEKHKTRFTHTR